MKLAVASHFTMRLVSAHFFVARQGLQSGTTSISFLKYSEETVPRAAEKAQSDIKNYNYSKYNLQIKTSPTNTRVI